MRTTTGEGWLSVLGLISSSAVTMKRKPVVLGAAAESPPPPQPDRSISESEASAIRRVGRGTEHFLDRINRLPAPSLRSAAHRRARTPRPPAYASFLQDCLRARRGR